MTAQGKRRSLIREADLTCQKVAMESEDEVKKRGVEVALDLVTTHRWSRYKSLRGRRLRLED